MLTNLSEEARLILAPHNINPDAIERIVDAYNEPWRTYHNANHILQMLELARKETQPNVRQKLELLILYHDVWYKVGQEHGVNERNSAQWGVSDLRNSPNPESVRLTTMLQQGIEATATHTLDKVSPSYIKEVALLLDLDLWGLGQPLEHFQTNTELVWQEFQPIATRDQYDAGRAQWAKRFIARSRIYLTETYRDLENRARVNLSTLLTD